MAAPTTAAAADSAPDRRLQAAAAIGAAIVVAVGVVWLDWPAFIVLALYWIENVVIGIANVFRMFAVGFGAGLAGAAGSLFLVPFFCVHYGMFCMVHGVFVVALFSGDPKARDVFFDAPFYMLGRVLSEGWGWVALLAIIATVVIDTARWFGRRREGNMLDEAKNVMHEPYGRIVVLHVVLLAGGFLMMVTKAPQVAVLLLTAFKLAYELRRLFKT